MARAMVYRGSSNLLHVDPPNDEVDPLELPIKAEPSSPLMESVPDFPEPPYNPPDSTSATESPDPPESRPDPLDSPAPPQDPFDSPAPPQDPLDSPAPPEDPLASLAPPQDPLDSPAPPDYDSSASSSLNSSKSQKPRSSDPFRIAKNPRRSRQLARFLLNNRSKLRESRLRTRSLAISASLAYECPVCYAQYNDRSGLSKHLSFFRGAQKRIVCHVCRKAVETPHQLLSHRKSSHRHIAWPEAPYKCDHCPLSYSSKMSLQMHLFHYHDLANDDKPVKRRVRKVARPSVASNIQIASARSERKQRRDQLALERSESLPKPSTARRRSTNRPGPKSSKSPRSNPPPQSSSSSANTSSANAPFVQIHAVPQEVEALLSDYEGSPMKKTKLDEAQKLPEVVELTCLRSGRARARPDVVEEKPQELDSKTEVKAKTPLKRPSLPQQTPKRKGTPMILATRKVKLLQTRYNCRECYVSLTRIETLETEVNESPELLSQIEGTSIDLQLKNLEIALKKLEVPHSPCPDESPVKIEKTGDSMKSKTEIYRSSVCRTRFTTKQKLINHYLCFHTNSSQDECGVCRIRCGNSRKLKNHLLLHCVKIIQSKQDRSPIDPKGPCEKYRKKHLCHGCKKRFWLRSCLTKHQEFCRFTQSEIKKIPEKKENAIVCNNAIVRRTSPRKLERKTSDIQSAKGDCQEEKTVHQDKTDPVVAEVSRVESHNATWSLPPMKIHEQPSVPPENHWWNKKVTSAVLGNSCSTCNNHFQTAANLAEHKRKFTPKQFSRCDICGTLFPSRNLLSSHKKMTHFPDAGTSKIRCPVCDQGFAKKSNLRAHLLHIHYDQISKGIEEWRQPTTVYEMKCKVCKLIFQNRRRFIEHSLYYLDDEMYNCNICDSRFVGKFRCHFHLKTEHYSKEMQQAYTHHCPICNEGFMYQSHLHAHMFHVHDLANDAAINGGHLVNTDDPFVCATCEQRFASIKLLDQHQNFYSNDGKYQCDKCERKCRSISILECHLRASHSSRTDAFHAKCPICGEGISSKTSWISHIKHAHANPTNQPSEFCLENVCTLNELTRESGESHRIGGHSNQSTVSLEEDVVLLDEDDDLSIPEVQTANIEFNCAICDEKFTSSQELKSHKITHGPVNYVYEDSLNYSNVQLNLSSKGHEFITEPQQLPKMPLNDFIGQSLETAHLPCIPSQDSGAVHSYSTDKDPCNFSITNIYSVGLDEYEKLANNQPQDVTTKNSEGNETAEIPLKCEICHLVFTCGKTLQNHLIRYSNSGDYVCEVCGRRFKWLRVFRSHIRKHHKKKNGVVPLYYCEQCDEAFATRNSKHMHFAHIHSDLHMKISDDDDVTIVESEVVDKAGGNLESVAQEQANKQTIEVDLTEDEEEDVADPRVVKNPVESAPTQTVTPLSAAVKPTVAQARVQPTAHRPTQVAPNICPIVCNICHVESIDVEFLVKHFATAHGIRLAPYKPNTQYDPEVQSNYQNVAGMKNHSTYQVNSRIDSEPPALFYYCKSCRIQFANEYSLLTHLRNAHAKNETVAGKQDNWNSSDTNSSGGGERVMVGSKVQGQSAGVVSMETSFINSDKYMSNADSSAPENAMDLTKKRTDNVVLSKIDLEGGPDRPYRILGGKNSQNIQFISVQKKDLVSLTRQRLQMSKSPEGNNIP
ncbi:uncharacterized protein LOC107040683 [Diachasma alloeum]|uniref:uncharacterized protein LOC107040683 n=1 Tax=Diachasma alloeum TaxID=454923 RepID=UPI00073840F0|nr:uncharacterized protein LOC107040683 [Diachasma alloeum]